MICRTLIDFLDLVAAGFPDVVGFPVVLVFLGVFGIRLQQRLTIG
jgi:hypothetical protein